MSEKLTWKKENLKQFEEYFKKHCSVIFFQYKHINADDNVHLRHMVKLHNGIVKFGKKNIFKRCVKFNTECSSLLKNQLFIIFNNDISDSLQLIQLLIKQFTSKITLLTGLSNTQLLNKNTLEQLSQYTSKEHAIASSILILQQPIRSIINYSNNFK